MLKPTMVALFVMLSLIWLLQSLRFMDWIINKGLDIGTFLWITVLIIPSLLIVIIPLSVFTGACFSYKRLGDDSEMTTMFAAGINRWRAVRPSVFAALLSVMACYSISLYFLPWGMSSFKALQHDLRQTGGNLLLEEGTFNQIGDNLMVYMKYRSGSNELNSLLVHDTRNVDKPTTWMASKGEVIFNEDGYPRLVLHDGIRQEVSEERLSILEFKKHTLDIRRKIKREGVRWKGAEERFMHELTDYENTNDRQVNQFKAEYQKRLVWPLTPLPLLLIAAMFIARPIGRHHTTMKGTVYAIVGAVIYQTSLMVANSMASRGIEAALYGQWALPIGVSFICFIALIKKRGVGA